MINLRDYPSITGNVVAFLNQMIRLHAVNILEIAQLQPQRVTNLEQDAHERWVDEQDVYFKTIAISELFCETNNTAIAHNIDDFGGLIRAEGRFKDGSTWYTLPYHNSAGASIALKVDSTNVTSMISGTPAFTGWGEGYVTVWYTKS
jgi:hypothetical protein